MSSTGLCRFEVQEGEGGRYQVVLSGHVSLATFTTLRSEVLTCLADKNAREIVLDLARVDYVDSAGALLLIEMENEARFRSMPFSFVNLSPKVEGIIGLIDRKALFGPPLIQKGRAPNLVEQLGKASLSVADDVIEAITFGGELFMDTLYSLGCPRSLRWGDVLTNMKKVGVDGLPIVALISFLLGLIMAFMSSLQLKQFGANIYVASLVSIAMVKELGPIMTAIIVAGRSGSAFAAEIGTMKVNEEVDAMSTMGFNPIRFLAVPKLLAASIVFPLLTIFSDVFAIGGGMAVGVLGLNLTVFTYVQETIDVLDAFDIATSIIKSVVFALFIAGIGCLRGFQVRGGAEAVGNATTSAVVSSLFLIIVIDSAFAIVLHYIG